MCSYCGCRAIGPIRDLTLEHVEIRNLMGEVRRAVERDDLDAAVEHLTALLPVLTAHDAVEELSIYRSMERVPGQTSGCQRNASGFTDRSAARCANFCTPPP